MLTGLEQYSFERAGYFIRRGAVPAELAAECAAAMSNDPLSGLALAVAERVRPTLQDLAGPGLRPRSLHIDAPGDKPGIWTRASARLFGPDAVAEMAILVRTRETGEARIALSADESLLLLPGTHASPISPEDRAVIELNPTSAAPGQVRIRLSAGDALFWNTNVVHRYDASSRRGVLLAAALRASGE